MAPQVLEGIAVVPTCEDLEKRVGSHLRSVHLLEGKLQELERQRDDFGMEIESLGADIHILEHTVVLFDKMLQDLVGESLDKIKKLTTTGLRLIFNDQTLSFSAELGMDRKQPSLAFYLEDETTGIKAPIRGNFGGGPVAVADMLLRVICILKLNLNRVMLLDEALSQVSSLYLPNAGEFLQKLCTKLQMTILLVTHSDFRGSAHKVYRATLKGGALQLKLEKDN